MSKQIKDYIEQIESTYTVDDFVNDPELVWLYDRFIELRGLYGRFQVFEPTGRLATAVANYLKEGQP